MSKTTKRILLIVVVILVYYYARVANAARYLDYSGGSVSNFKADLKSGYITWNQGINIMNGDSIAIPINRASVQVFTGSTAVGYALLEKPFTITGRGISEMKLRVIIPLQNLLSMGMSVYNQAKAGVINANMVGVINTIGVSYPLKYSFDLKLS